MSRSGGLCWLHQAASDLRVAKALRQQPRPLQSDDVGCHLAAMCCQAVEKSIKGYLTNNRLQFAHNHRPETYLRLLLRDQHLRYRDHYGVLSKLFDSETRAAVGALLQLAPGAAQTPTLDQPDTEYPWKRDGSWSQTPVGDVLFAGSATWDRWLKLTQRIHEQLRKLAVAADRLAGP